MVCAGKTIAGKYKILAELGRGGMGVVYKAKDTRLDRTVALKFLPAELTRDEESKQRFVQEAKAAAALEYPNICTVYEVDEADGQTFIAMSYIEGQSMKNKLQDGPMDVDEAKDIAIQVAEGLKEAHEKGIVHRDIKPANIMLTKKGQARITDFGLAKLSWGADLTKPATLMGTVAYMSPEQARGEDVDQRTDIWALGAMMYEMLSGERPFQKNQEQALIYSILNDKQTPLSLLRSEIPTHLEKVIEKALAKKAGERYQNVDDLIQELKEVPSTTPPNAEKSIAVLPFTNMSADPEQEYFCDGLAEEIINALTKIKDLKVVARMSAFFFKGKDVDIREVGKKLDVTNVLEGSVRKSANRLRITAQLINVKDGYHLWSERYDRDFKDVFEIQDEISLAIVEALKMKLLKKEKVNLMKRHTNDTVAFNYYLKGRYFWNKRTEDGLAKSVKNYEKAIERDSQFALAFAGLADSIATQGFYDFILPRKEAFAEAKKYALKALEKDDSIGETHAAVANIKSWCEYDWIGAEPEYKKALELNPSDAEANHMYAHLLTGLLRFDEAKIKMKLALELEPLSVNFNSCFGNILFQARRYDEAMKQFQLSIEINPDFSLHHYWLGRVYIEKKRYRQAWESLEKAMTFPEIHTLALGALAYAYGVSKNINKAVRVSKRLIDLTKKKYVDPFHMAVAHLGLGEEGIALSFLKKACEELSMYILYLPTDPIFDHLRRNPEFVSLLKTLKIA
jgi:serine/threonine protein kinase/Tfp pilus assembly protein PilF